MKKLIVILALVIIGYSLSANSAVVIEINDMIAGGSLRFIERELSNAERSGQSFFVIKLNTPGGLVDDTFKINEKILNAKIPVIVYVSPSGAMAASAGAFIVLSADIAVMSPATTIGAAQPLSITTEGIEDAGDKTRKFLSRHIRSLAEEKNRPLDIVEDFVKNNLTLTANEALYEGVIDYIAEDLSDLFDLINGTVIEKKGNQYHIKTEGIYLEYLEMKQNEIIQQWLSNPQMAFLFLIMGIAGLYFGLSNPGTYVPEVLGAISLIIGIYGIGLFSSNIAGVILIFSGIGLIVAEIFTSGFGILGIGGIIALVTGALLLPVEPLMGFSWYSAFIKTVVGVGLGLGIVLIVIVQRILSSRKRTPLYKINLTFPEKGIVVEELNPDGLIKAKGEIWKAYSKNNQTIAVGKEVKTVQKDSLTLWAEENKSKED